MTYGLLPYALPRLTQAVVDVALAPPGSSTASGILCAKMSCHRRFFEPYLQGLCQDGVLVGSRGPYGGYRLGRPTQEISIGDLYRVVERYLIFKRDQSRARKQSQIDDQPVSGVAQSAFEQIDAKIMAELDAVTIADLMRPLVEAGGGI